MKIFSYALLAFAMVNSAIAQTSQIEELAILSIEELSKVRITTIATGTKEKISEAPAVATIITAQEIELMGATSVEEVLETVPGLHVTQTDSYYPRFDIRGITSRFNSQVLVMINGIPITSLIRGDRNARLSTIPVKMVSKIEVIRGPGSALYGADAVAGVINVITKDYSDINGTQLGGRAGSFETGELWYLHGGKYEDLKTSLMMTYEQTEGQREKVKEDAQTRLDQLTGTNASLAPGNLNLSGTRLALALDATLRKWRIRGSYHQLRDAGTGHGIAAALDPYGRYYWSRNMLDVTYHDPKISEEWDFTSNLSYMGDTQQVDKPARIFPSGANLGNGVFTEGVLGSPEYWERHIRFDNSGVYRGFDKHAVSIGVGYIFADVYKTKDSINFTSDFTPLPDPIDVSDTPRVHTPELSRSSYYIYLQDQWKFRKSWELISGVRFDEYSDFGSTVNPRVALIWKTSPKLTTKLLYGRAFRAPSFTELYTRSNPIVIGSSTLEPETIDVYELAWAYQANSKWSLGLNIFHYKASNLISFVPDASGISTTAQNFGVRKGDGLEFETKAMVSKNVSLIANYAYVKATDEISGEPAGEYPSHQGYLRGDWRFRPLWNLDAQVRLIGTRDRAPNDDREKLEGYSAVDLTFSRNKLWKSFYFKFSIRNLFDEEIFEPSGGPGPTSNRADIPNDLPQAGRNYYASLTYHF